MTEKQLGRIVKTWQDRLYLNHWDIRVKWEIPADEGNEANINVSADYENASIRFEKGWAKWGKKKANEVVVHELLHIFEKGTYNANRSLEAALNPDAYQIIEAWYTHASENWIDRLALILVELGGLV